MINYLITDPKYYSNDLIFFEEKLIEVFKNKKVDMACFRDKESKNFKSLAKIFIKVCKKFNIKRVLLNGDYVLAKELGANGVHLTSKQFEHIQKAKDLNLYTIISCHNIEDIKNAKNNNIDAITYSPIFKTLNKGEPKGVSKLKDIIENNKDLNIIALGGIVDDETLRLVSQTNAYGFASIRYFI